MSVHEKMTAIADAIRGKTGKTEPLTLAQMPTEIAGIETAPVLEPLTVTENGEFTPGEGVDGFDKVTVDVEPAYECSAWYRQPNCPDITALPFEDSEYLEVYYTIDKQLPGASDIIKVVNYGYVDRVRVELGYVEDGRFVVVKSYHNNGIYTVTHEVDLRLVDVRFPVIHWLPEYKKVQKYANEFKVVLPEVTAPVIELAYSGTYSRSFHCDSGAPNVNIRAITCCAPGTRFETSGIALRCFPTCVELLDFSRHDSVTVVSRFLANFAMGLGSLRYVKFPNVAKNSVLLDTASQSNWPISAFQNCGSLLEVDLSIFDSSECNQIQSMFQNCYSLKTIDISGWNMSLVTNTSNTFSGCKSLENINTDGCTMPAVSFKLSDSPLLSVDSLIGVIAALPVLEEGKAATLTLGATNTAKLTAEQLAVATEKGWTLA